jgi:hypothetical protein
MIDPAQRVQNTALAPVAVSMSGRSRTTESQSFTVALSDALGERTKIASENEPQPANFALGQQNVPRRDPVATPPSTPQPSGLGGLVITTPDPSLVATAGTATATPSTTATASASTATASTANSESFDEAYWASQPAAVQQLQNIQDPTQRADLASQLAGEGYTIDVPIMVWGWDPQITTAARESMGYTWVPSALQPPVEVAPGLTFNGTSYNAANPPAGSISV